MLIFLHFLLLEDWLDKAGTAAEGGGGWNAERYKLSVALRGKSIEMVVCNGAIVLL